MELDNVQSEIVIETAEENHVFFRTSISNSETIKKEEVDQAVKSIKTELNDDLEFKVYLGSEDEYPEDIECLPDHNYGKDKKIPIVKWNGNFFYENKMNEDNATNNNKLFSTSKKDSLSRLPGNLSFADKVKCQKHLKNCELQSNLSYNCEICGKTFKQAYLLKNHVRIHFIEKKFVCIICQKMFAVSDHLKNHLLVHSGEKNFQCSICPKTFRQKGHLLNHIRAHNGVKKFSCPLCNKKFTQNIHMRSHLKTHTGEKDYSCKICQKQFTQSGHLQMHMTVHTGERRYECSHCEMRFKQSGHLSSHLKIHAKSIKVGKPN